MKVNVKNLLFIFLSFCLNSFSQSDSLGMAGDHLDLKAVLTIFKESANTEEFEKKLNSADTKVNNLDLNGDGQVDYLRVLDTKKGDEHSIIIQTPISKSESQDVAVIHVEKKGNNKAHLQIVGDEILYGKDYIIEPDDEGKTSDKSKKKQANEDDVYAGKTGSSVVVNVWTWPSVVYLYSPGYVMWVSPWYWEYYPPWYSPWAPYSWYVYHHHIIGYPYFVPCRYGSHYYNPHARKMYYGKRTSSGYVEKTAVKYEGRKYGEEKINKKRNDQPPIRNKNEEKVLDQPKGDRQNGKIRPNRTEQNNPVKDRPDKVEQNPPKQNPNKMERQPSPRISPKTNPSDAGGQKKSNPRDE